MTGQVREKLILDGAEVSMAFCPELPTASGLVTETPALTLSQRINSKEWPSYIHSTACWRRYIGTWEIRDGKLYLVDVIGQFQMTTAGPIFADWVTAVLRVPQGELIQYVHMGFASVHEAELHIKIEKGHVIEHRRIDNSTKQLDRSKLAFKNLPGGENRFDGDDL
jgi:hypothetical protein